MFLPLSSIPPQNVKGRFSFPGPSGFSCLPSAPPDPSDRAPAHLSTKFATPGRSACGGKRRWATVAKPLFPRRRANRNTYPNLPWPYGPHPSALLVPAGKAQPPAQSREPEPSPAPLLTSLPLTPSKQRKTRGVYPHDPSFIRDSAPGTPTPCSPRVRTFSNIHQNGQKSSDLLRSSGHPQGLSSNPYCLPRRRTSIVPNPTANMPSVAGSGMVWHDG